jgi:hypothetical protein
LMWISKEPLHLSQFQREVWKKDSPLPFPCPQCKSDCHESTSPWDSGEMGFATVASMECVIITCGHRVVVV